MASSKLSIDLESNVLPSLTGLPRWTAKSLPKVAGGKDPSPSFWLSTEESPKEGAIAIVFRPTGITYEGRQTVLGRIIEASHVPSNELRFSLEIWKGATATGGIEVLAHLHEDESGPMSRLSMAMDGLWARRDDVGRKLGTIGFVPREISSYIRPLLTNYPYIMPYWQPGHDSEFTLSLSLVLVIWRLDPDYIAHMLKGFLPAYAETIDRTNLMRWNPELYVKTRTITPGYAGKE